MKTTINPSALYWASFNRFELRLPGQCVIDCAHSGDCLEDVKQWATVVSDQVKSDNFRNAPTPDKIRAELAEYGAWDEPKLEDDAANWFRLVWIAACNIAEDETPDCSQPLTN